MRSARHRRRQARHPVALRRPSKYGDGEVTVAPMLPLLSKPLLLLLLLLLLASSFEDDVLLFADALSELLLAT